MATYRIPVGRKGKRVVLKEEEGIRVQRFLQETGARFLSQEGVRLFLRGQFPAPLAQAAKPEATRSA